MKTFETEKNNIPEGATHYCNEESFFYFSWVKVTDSEIKVLVPDSANGWCSAKSDYYTSRMKPIPKPELVEWNGEGLPPVGVECELDAPQRSEIIKIKVISHIKDEDGDDIVFYEIKNRSDGEFKYDWCFAVSVRFIKPESPEEKEKRERLEAAYDLYCDAQHAVDVIAYDSFEQFKADDVQVKFWLAIVDKTNYRKGE